MTPKKIASLGECMVELSPLENNTYARGFAGDSLNTAIYIQRSLREQPVETSYITALGPDPLSQKIREFIASENIDCSLIGTVADKRPGLYSIELDDAGERTFSYWRNDSAAKKLLDGGLTDEQQQRLAADFDLIYFSGISLAILDTESRVKLFKLLTVARSQGTKIAFDSNYRPALWESPDTAKKVMAEFLTQTDIAMMTFDDEQMLHGDDVPQDTMARLKEAGVPEIVVKDGANGCLIHSADYQGLVKSEKVASVVDTTSAGDSFNAGYMAGRVCEQAPEQAALFAHQLAANVIQHKGAIIPLEHCAAI